MKPFLDSQRTTWEIHDSSLILGYVHPPTISPDCILYHPCMCLHLRLKPRDTAVPFQKANFTKKKLFRRFAMKLPPRASTCFWLLDKYFRPKALQRRGQWVWTF